MSSTVPALVTHVTERVPATSAAELVGRLVPPPQFARASFDSYRPDKAYPSQAAAVETLRRFATSASGHPGGFFSRWHKQPETPPGVYLDGGFGVGKTHLLAALWHSVAGRTYYGTFIEYTALVGALGYRQTVDLLAGADLLCIDEFELDDPGDTMVMTRLIGALVDHGTKIAATSNTPPNALGEGRFAAHDFLREIQSIARSFRTLRIDGLDYRRRDAAQAAQVLDPEDLGRAVDALASRGKTVSFDAFRDVVDHLAEVHPSRYADLVGGLDVVALSDVTVLHDQTEALRLVAFIDRVYDLQIPVLASGAPLDGVFDAEMLAGGYRKKYLRAASRIVALTSGELPPGDADAGSAHA
ncbi:MAG TPA: cell division protein ZapE [Microbacteriaceae bacterium]|nr:cell division protein ZapE [Microbacteriaceae bacterium]